jgi:hypothetical protein
VNVTYVEFNPRKATFVGMECGEGILVKELVEKGGHPIKVREALDLVTFLLQFPIQ